MKKIFVSILIFLSTGCITLTEELNSISNKDLVKQYFKKWEEGTGSVFELLSDDANWTITGKNHEVSKSFSKSELTSKVLVPFNSHFTAPLKPQLKNIYSDQDTVLLYFTAQASTKTNYHYENTYLWILKMKDQKIIDVVAFLDMIEFEKVWRLK